MKKTLLTLAIAAMVAIGANAQFKNMHKVQNVQNLQKMNVTELVKADAAAPAARIAPIAMLQSKSARRAAGNISGTYIFEYADWAGEFITSTSFTIEAAEGTITLDQYENSPSFDYNVKISGLTDSRGTVYGKFDAESKELLIPCQTMFTNATYGRVVFSSLLYSNGQPYTYGGDMVFVFDEDGNISVSDEDFSDEEFEGSLTIGGYWAYLPDYETEGTDGQKYAGLWNRGTNIETFTPNAIMHSREVYLTSSGWGDWTDTDGYPVHVEDYESELLVHNFLGLIPMSLGVEGNKCSIALPVVVNDYEQEEPYGNYQLWRMNETKDALVNTGEMTGNVETFGPDNHKNVRFYDLEKREAWTDEDGDHPAGTYRTNPTYFYLGTNPDTNGARYWLFEAVLVDIIYNDYAATGINEVNAASKSSKMTYNLMGQKVNGAVKGLVIRDGKKFVVK